MTPLHLLERLISIPSVNPMGQPREGPEFYEGRMSDFLEDLFEGLGIPVERIEVTPGRDNVIARLTGSDGLPTVLLDAHQDTVPVDQMTIDPFDPVVRGDRIHGRGSCDVKGGMAAMIAAFSRLAKEPPSEHATVVMACTCDEEQDELGVLDIVRLFDSKQRQSRFLKSPPDMVVVAEPTELNVAVAHRGSTRWKLRTAGRAAHSSDPSKGINAIYRMARVVRLLNEFADRLSRESKLHPLCGPSTLSVGRIKGGTSVNIVPAECTIEIERRIVPGEDGSGVIRQLDDFLRDRLDFDFEMLPPWTVGVTLSDENNGALSQRLLSAAQSAFPASRIIGVPFGTHAARYAQSGVPSVVFGPGSVAQAHTDDEWLDIPQLEAAAEVIYRFISSWS